jgi:hypothetical protein
VSKWEWCARTNGTYIDCPLAERTTQSFVVVAQNPSAVDIQYVKLKVAHGNYNVQVFNETMN